MKAIKVMATIDERGQLCVDEPLKLERNSRVEVIVLVPIDRSSFDDEYQDRIEHLPL